MALNGERTKNAEEFRSDHCSASTSNHRSSPCRLFIASAEESRRICIICGFHEIEHYKCQVLRNKPPLPSTPCPSTNKASVNCAYDVRVEYLPRSSFQAKYGSKLPIVFGDDNYLRPRVSANTVAPDRGLVSDSEATEEHSTLYSGTNLLPLYPDCENLHTVQQLSVEDHEDTMFHNPIMLSPSKTSAFDEYRPSKSDHGPQVHQIPQPRKKTAAPPPPPLYAGEPENQQRKGSGVSFQVTCQVISCDGGQEYFTQQDEDDGEEDFDDDLLTAHEGSDMDDPDWICGRNSDFDKITESNTEFNANPKNLAPGKQEQPSRSLIEKVTSFVKFDSRADVHIPVEDVKVNHHKVGDIVRQVESVAKPQQVSKVTVQSNVESSSSTESCSDTTARTLTRPQRLTSTGGHQLDDIMLPPTFSKVSNESPSPSKDLSELSSNFGSSEETSMLVTPEHQATKANGTGPVVKATVDEDFSYIGRKSGKFNKSVDDRLRKMALELEMQRKTPKRPAPPPPPPTANRNTPLLAHSSSTSVDKENIAKDARVVNGCSTRNSVDSSPPIDINICRHMPKKTVNGCRSVSQEPSLRSTPESETYAGGRGKFASIRKFLRFEQKNGETSKFQSLRRLPSPFGRTRVDLSQLKGLFHGVETCTAADEIAHDSDVIVTDITELNSAANTLTRKDDKREKEDSLSKEEKRSASKFSIMPRRSSEEKCHSNGVAPSESTPVMTSTLKEDAKNSFRKILRQGSPNTKVNGSIRNHANRNSCMEISSSYTDPQGPRKDTDPRKLIEENYDQMTLGHVITLSQLSENFPDLAYHWKRKCSTITNPEQLKWTDFVLISNSPMMVTESAAFYPGVLKMEHELIEVQVPKVNIMITPIKYSNPMSASVKQYHKPFFLPVITEFQEYVPSKLLRLTNLEDENEEEEDSGSESPTALVDHEPTSTLCKISVLPRLVLTSLESYADQTANRHHPLKQPSLHEKDVCFVMIQLITALKYLQSHGVEEVPSDLDGFLLIRSTSSSSSRPPQLSLCWEAFASTPESKSKQSARISLCQSALACLCLLLHTEVPTEELIREKRLPKFPVVSAYTEGFQKVAEVLKQERSHSLTLSKSLLEHMYWVSNHMSIIQDVSAKFENEFASKLWLEHERAKQVCAVLKMLLKQMDDVDIVEEYRIQFLLHTSPKQLFDASRALEDQRRGDATVV